LINYLLFTVGIGSILYILGIFKKITGFVYDHLKAFYYKYIKKESIKEKTIKKFEFDEVKSNEMINSQDFYFLTGTDLDKKIINLGQFHSTVIIEKTKVKTPPNPKEYEVETLYNLKRGKDECLINIVKKVKNAGGNGIIDLDIQYSLIGIGGESYQVTAFGMGVYLSKNVRLGTVTFENTV
jgi:hypothetical protein